MALLFSNLIVFIWFLCSRFAVSCPDWMGKGNHLKVFKQKCYEFINKKDTRENAIASCVKKDGILAEIRDIEIQNFIINTVVSELKWSWDKMHTGARKETGKGPYYFQNDDELSFESWEKGATDCFWAKYCKKNCAILKFGSKLWTDTYCKNSYFYACEYNLDISTTEQTQTSMSTEQSCPCDDICKSRTLPIHEIEKKLVALKKDLQIDKKTLSSYRRKIRSEHDDRLSSKVMGTLGGSIIVGAVLIIVLPDMYKLYVYLKRNRVRQRSIGSK